VKENNICQTIWDKSEVLWRTCWQTYWEPIGNSLGTLKEHSGNNTLVNLEKLKNIPSPPPPPTKLRKEKKQGTLSASIFHLPQKLDEVPPKFNFLFLQQANLISPSLYGGSPK
jgi:hypothetical protein